MECPVCPQTALVMSERQGIEIDYCPKCRGVWLDRGELDKILERAVTAQPAAAAPPPQQPQYQPQAQPAPYGNAGGYGRRDDDRYREQKYYKKKSIWHELFD
ncbi:zf-TFIIB domain-containing protein [Cupriavidus respiraculi]|uniref:TFIIB-type zinc ribbon-containing protein n=1 Tax=Cupriavidus respiraculi TaxID=195930 RepID=UPI001C975F48|nr:zf-TFIIB domain-containing protein [Cupriavidus respiraculi]MBY4948321.1 zf-TFIIB domain-containing protein [Cupriavidus respiraculi]